MKYALAIDLGASGGRHILGHIEAGKLVTEEVHRFTNAPILRAGSLVWDAERLYAEILTGLKKCAACGKIPDTVGIDTWGVDYALLDKRGELIGPIYCYRDGRGGKAAEKLHSHIPHAVLYASTGTQYQPFNTVYQLYDDRLTGRLEQAEDMLLLPSYLSYLLTGERRNEYTDASTTGLLDAATRDWAYPLLDRIGLPQKLFHKPAMPGVLGRFTPAVAAAVGFDAAVVLPATHDTASAVFSVTDPQAVYLSSGTWSLLGRQIERPILSGVARVLNYTNEGGADGRIRFLRNIMGLWLIQRYRQETGDVFSFAELADMAEREAVFDWAIDVDDESFIAPPDMAQAVQTACVRIGAPAPTTPGQTAHCIFSSLAHAYASAADRLDELLQTHTDTIYIVGGGSRNRWLNTLTERYSGRKVVTGHPEATAVGNLGAQFVATGVLDGNTFGALVEKSIRE